MVPDSILNLRKHKGETCDVSWGGKMVRKRPNRSLPVLDQRGEGRTELRECPNGSDRCRSSAPAAVSVFSLCIFASSSPISDRALTMVDILMLMFFAIMGLVFLSYIIYMLWSCCQPRRRPMRNPDDAPSSLRHPWSSSWTVVGQRFFSTHVLTLSNWDAHLLDQLPVFVFARLLWSRLENTGVLQWSFLNVSDRLWPVEGVEIWPWWVPTGAFTPRVKSDPGEPNGGRGAKPLPCSLALPSLPHPADPLSANCLWMKASHVWTEWIFDAPLIVHVCLTGRNVTNSRVCCFF